MEINWKLTGAIITFLLLASGVLAQTVSPTALEFKGPKAHGTILVSNQSNGVLTVRVKAQSFDWKDGVPYITPALDAHIHVTTKQKEFQLGPQQTKYIDFIAQCDSMPCHLYITPVFSTPHIENGVSFARWAPVAVYECSTQKACRKSTLQSAGAIPAGK